MSYGSTEIEYNGVRLVDVQTLKFEQEEICEPSGATPIYTRFIVRVIGYFLAQHEAMTYIRPTVGTANQTAGSQHVGLRHKLEARRGEFKMTVGAGGAYPTVLLEAKPITDTATIVDDKTDVQGGPRVNVISITNIAANNAIRVEVEWTICLTNCPDVGVSPGSDPQRQNGILSNKWSCAEDIDENFFIKSRTFVGELKLARPVVNPHDFRALVVPRMQPGLRLKSMHFKASEDCLSLQYQVTHEEVDVTAPYPATSIRISHKVHVAEFQVEVNEMLSVTLQGDRNVDKRDLIALATRIADGKLRLRDLIPPPGGGAAFQEARPVRLRSYEVFDESGTSEKATITIVYHLTSLPVKNEPVAGGVAVARITQRLGQRIDGTMIPNYDNTLSLGNGPGQDPATQGPLSIAGAFAAHLQGVCTTDHSANRGIKAHDDSVDQIRAMMPVTPTLPDATLRVFSVLPDLPDSTFSSAHGEGLYQTYEIDSQLNESTLTIQLPIATPTAGTGSISQGGGNNPGLVPATPATAGYTPGDTSVFCQLGGSQWERVVRICAQRFGKPPRLPNPLKVFADADGVQHVLLKSQVLACEPGRSTDGEANIYTMRAEFRYGMSRAPGRIQFPAPDYMTPVSLGIGQSPYEFTLASIFSSGHHV